MNYREIKPAYTKDDEQIYVYTNSDGVYVGDNESKTLTNKLNEIDKEINKGLQKIEENTTQLSNYLEFDLSNIKPCFHTILNVAKGTVLQNYVIDEDTDEIYTSQLIGTIPDGVAETYTLSRLNKQGKLMDSMDIKYGGHGTTFGLERENNILYIWSNYKITDEFGVTLSNALVRFPYEAGKTLTYTDESVQTYNKFNDYYTIPVIDQKNGLIALRYTDNKGVQKVELRKVSDVKKNINNTLGVVTIPYDLNYLQGITIDGYNLYWRVGDTNSVTYSDEIALFSFTDGSLKQRILCDFGTNTDGVYDDDFREPEGIHLYTDKKSGKKTLFASVVTGAIGRRIIKSYAFYQTGSGEKVISDMLVPVQKFELTQSNGKAKKIPYGLTSLSVLTDPGVYYMTTSESKDIVDHPSPNAGYWLEIQAMESSGGTQQVLKRNTGVGNYESYIRSIGSKGVASDWQKIGGNTSNKIPLNTTSLSSISTPGIYYMSTDETVLLNDHPMPGIAGWFLEVSPLATYSTHFYQILRRNTVTNKNMRAYYRQIQANTQATNTTDWMLIYSSEVPSIPVDFTKLSDFRIQGQYYMTTVEAIKFIDHPELNTTAGWFLEIGSNSPNGATYQILRKNVITNSNMKVYYRQVNELGVATNWRNMLPEQVVLWRGNCKGDFSTTFNLSETMNNFDYVYIKIESDTGINVTDRMILMSEWSSNELQFVFHNLSNTTSNLDYWLFEYAIRVNTEKTGFINLRSIRLKVAGLDGVKTRTDNDSTIGVTSIIGVKL